MYLYELTQVSFLIAEAAWSENTAAAEVTRD